MEFSGCGGEPDLRMLADSDRAECRKIASDYLEAMLTATATVVTLFNPKRVVLGGGVLAHNPDIVPKIEERIDRYALPASCEGLAIVQSRIENASMQGAKLLLDTMTTVSRD